jgi:hypothetical protein
MRQININVTPEFERDLRHYMRAKNLTTKSDAIRQALREAVAQGVGAPDVDFRSWLGRALRVPLRRRRRFRNEDELWS